MIQIYLNFYLILKILFDLILLSMQIEIQLTLIELILVELKWFDYFLHILFIFFLIESELSLRFY